MSVASLAFACTSLFVTPPGPSLVVRVKRHPGPVSRDSCADGIARQCYLLYPQLKQDLTSLRTCVAFVG